MIKSEGLLVKFKNVVAKQFSCNRNAQTFTDNSSNVQKKEKENGKCLNEEWIKQNSKIYGKDSQKMQ